MGDAFQGRSSLYYFTSRRSGLYIWGKHTVLIVASSDNLRSMGCMGTQISSADGTALGTGGVQNTIDIEARCTAAGTAADLSYPA
jgi:hypothetical protein